MKKARQFPPQVVGNMGLYFVCYRLSRDGWNVLPTFRNAKGPDIVLLNEDSRVRHTIQVKALSNQPPVPLGTSRENFRFDFLIACTRLEMGEPECFVMTKEEVLERVHISRGKDSLWLQPKDYLQDRFREGWARIPQG